MWYRPQNFISLPPTDQRPRWKDESDIKSSPREPSCLPTEQAEMIRRSSRLLSWCLVVLQFCQLRWRSLLDPITTTVMRFLAPMSHPLLILRRRLRVMMAIRQQVKAKAMTNIEKAQQRQKKSYDAKHRPPCFKEGDVVLLKNKRNEARKGGKLEQLWSGPYTITWALSKGVYKLKNNDEVELKTSLQQFLAEELPPSWRSPHVHREKRDKRTTRLLTDAQKENGLMTASSTKHRKSWKSSFQWPKVGKIHFLPRHHSLLLWMNPSPNPFHRPKPLGLLHVCWWICTCIRQRW